MLQRGGASRGSSTEFARETLLQRGDAAALALVATPPCSDISKIGRIRLQSFAQFGLHLGASGPYGLEFGGFKPMPVPFLDHVGAMLGPFGARVCNRWAGGVSRSVKNSRFHSRRCWTKLILTKMPTTLKGFVLNSMFS